MKTFPTLYKLASTGKHQEWTVSVDGSTIITRYGQVGGKIQEARDTVKEGKNAGKKNATTPEQQALSEAESTWEKKLKKGYVKSLDDAAAGKTDELITGGAFPMLAKSFAKDGDKIVYPAFAQPKFDGHRCVAVIEDGKATLWTRTRKPITGLPHIIKSLEQYAAKMGVKKLMLDGELYNHEYKSNFEELTSFIRNPEPKPGHEVVEYHIYDTVELDQDQNNRLATVLHFKHVKYPALVGVETISVADEDELMAAFDRFLAQGYEGLMVRNRLGVYKSHPTGRSSDLQKVKEFDDAEFVVIGVEEGRGKLAGKAIFVCKTEDMGTFRAKMKGKLEDLKKYIDNPKLAVGKQLTVQYQGFTNKSRVPRFPVGLRLREDV